MDNITTQPAATKFMIDKFVNLPEIKRGGLKPRVAIYPWAHMQPGDSFFVPGGASSHRDERPGLTKQITVAGPKKKYPDTTWAVRAVTEGGVNGVRVWRLT